MAKLLDQIIVIDVEATCWEHKPPPGQESEIIEIGYAVVDVSDKEVIEYGSWLTKPKHSKVSDFCTSLTSITQEMLDEDGFELAEACNDMRKQLKTKDRVWSSWGNYDKSQFERNCKLANINYPFGIRHINIKTLLALFAGMKNEPGMPQGLEHFGLKLEGTHHRGGDDANNIGKILCSMLKRYNVGGFIKNAQE